MDYSKTTDAGMRIQRNVTVPMRDGKLLRVDLYRPDHADEPLPVLIAWSPYGKHGQLDWRLARKRRPHRGPLPVHLL